MLTLTAKIRQTMGGKTKNLRKKGVLPAVIYGSKIKKSLPLEVDAKEFSKVYKEVQESGLVSVMVKDEEFLALVHDVARDYLTGDPIHVDFYQPALEKEIEVNIPLVFEGEAPAVKDLGGTFVKFISEIQVQAKPQNLPREIKVKIEKLKSFEDAILIKDLELPMNVKVLKDPQEIIASVLAPEKEEQPKEAAPESAASVPVDEKAGEAKAKEAAPAEAMEKAKQKT
ncbi:MAG: 50S ribosomal protein L25 [bacterium]